MPQIDPVTLQLNADIRVFVAVMAQAERTADQKLDAIQKSADKTASGLEQAFSLAGKSALRFLGGIGYVAAAREMLRLTDSAKTIEAQLRLATKESGSFAQAQADVRRIAADTRSDLEGTAALYANFQRNAQELGLTQEQAARATETAAKAFKISGASSEEASEGTRELVEALRSGAVSGDEFNGILRSAPRLAELFSDSLGVSADELRRMAETGELTSDRLIAALTDRQFTAGLDAEFRELPVTFDEAMQSVENAAITVFGAFDRGGQFSNAIYNFVTDGSQGFADLEGAAEAFGAKVSAELAGAIAVANGLVSAIRAINGALGGIPQRLAEDAWIFDYTNPLGLLKRSIVDSPLYQKAKAKRERENRYAEQERFLRDNFSLERFLAGPPQPRRGGGMAQRPKGGGGGPRGNSGNRRGGPSAEQIAERQETELARLGDEELRAQLELASDADRRAEIQKQLLANEREQVIQRLQKGKALTPEAQALIDTIYGTQSAFDEVQGIETDGKIGLRAKAINRDTDREQAELANDMLRRQSDTLGAWADLETNTSKRNELEQRALGLQQEIERNLLDQEIASGKIADAENARALLGERQAAARGRLARDQLSPGQRYVSDLRTAADNVNEAVEGIAVEGLESLNDGLAQAILGVESLGDVFKNVANQIIADLLRIAVQKSIIGPLSSFLFGPGANHGTGATDPIGDIIRGGKAVGGPVMAGGTYLVGERGPELLQMGGRGGVIIPNHDLVATRGGRNAPSTINVTVNARDAVLTHTVRQWVAEGVQQATVLGSQLGSTDARGRIARQGRNTLPG